MSITSVTLLAVELVPRVLSASVPVLALRVTAIDGDVPHRWDIRRTRQQLVALLRLIDVHAGDSDALNVKALSGAVAISRATSPWPDAWIAEVYSFLRFHPVHSLSNACAAGPCLFVGQLCVFLFFF